MHRFRWRHGLACAISVVAMVVQSADASESDGVATFTGSIDERSVSAFIAAHRDETLDRVILDSPGGDVVAALSLANWMVDRRVDVEVRNLCASSCANYLFAAGRRKIIDDRAIVVWHGSMLQKNFRERCEPKAPRSEPENGPPGYVASLTARSREAEAVICAWYSEVVAIQDAFFARVDVDEYITRMGQEPTDLHALWTVPVSVMKRMGLAQVEARVEYASPGDIKHFNHGPDDPEPILSLAYDDRGNVIVLGR